MMSNLWREPSGEEVAQGAGLRYVDDSQPGYSRLRWEAAAQTLKFERLRHFAGGLPHIRSKVEQDLAREALSKRKITAVIVHLLGETGMRIGHDSYTERYGSYGLTTLCDEHLTYENGRLLLEFVGKAQVEQQIPIGDRELQQRLEACAAIEGERLFQYVDAEGERNYLTNDDVNAYLHSCVDAPFTSKDFRTWAGTIRGG